MQGPAPRDSPARQPKQDWQSPTPNIRFTTPPRGAHTRPAATGRRRMFTPPSHWSRAGLPGTPVSCAQDLRAPSGRRAQAGAALWRCAALRKASGVRRRCSTHHYGGVGGRRRALAPPPNHGRRSRRATGLQRPRPPRGAAASRRTLERSSQGLATPAPRCPSPGFGGLDRRMRFPAQNWMRVEATGIHFCPRVVRNGYIYPVAVRPTTC